MNSSPINKHMKIKKQTLLLFFAILMFLLMSSCTAQRIKSSNYRIIGMADLDEDNNYNFNETLTNLYTDNTSLVLATLQIVSEESCSFTVDEVIFGYLGLSEYVAKYPLENYGLISGEKYMLFVEGTGEDLSLSVDSAGWLKIDSGNINSQSGKNISLQKVRFEAEKIDVEIFLPSDFLFYRNLDDLVINSDTIFIGTIRTIQERPIAYYYNNANEGFKRSMDSPTEIVFADIEKMIKGDENVSSVLIYDSDVMHSMVLDNATNEVKQINPESDLQRKYQNARYVFFIKSTPLKDAPYSFFINPIQGLVPLDADNNTYPIYNNPGFTHAIYIEDLTSDINSILDGLSSLVNLEISPD